MLGNGVQGHTDIFYQLFSLFTGDVIWYCHFHVLDKLVSGTGASLVHAGACPLKQLLESTSLKIIASTGTIIVYAGHNI